MTQGVFIQYLLDNGCSVNQDHEGEFYKIKRRDAPGNSYKSTMPLNGNYSNMKLMTICLVCHFMDVPKPIEVQDYDNQFFVPVIVENHFKTKMLN